MRVRIVLTLLSLFALPLTASAVGDPPVACFVETVRNCFRTVCFDASCSTDDGGLIWKYAWNFGDGTTGNGQTICHTFPATDSYTVTLLVWDAPPLSGGDADTTQQTVTPTQCL